MIKIRTCLFALCFFSVLSFLSVSFAGDLYVAVPVCPIDTAMLSGAFGNASADQGMTAAEIEMEDEGDDDFLDDYEEGPVQLTVADPLYYFNYAMYGLNDFFYFVILKPAAVTYKTITPEFFRKGVRNFFHNLFFPVRFVNNLLQGEVHDAGTEVGIFLLNTTVGVAGLGQVAQNVFDIHTNDEDFGQTLGSWSVGNGFYLVLPFLGPSTLRDSIGLVGDYFLKPTSYLDIEWSLGATAVKTVNNTTFRIGDYEALKDAALDPYVAIRDAYIKNRQHQVEE